MKLGILYVSYVLALRKGLWKLELAVVSASPDCSRRCEAGVEAVVADTAARREDEVAEVGSVCRVQLRRAEPADAGTGRIFGTGEKKKVVRVEVGA